VRSALAAAAAALLATGTLLMAGAGPASAHDVLLAADPVADSVLAAPPAAITLTFNQDVRPEFSQMAITVGSASQTVIPTVDGPIITAAVPAAFLEPIPDDIGPQLWRIGYRIVSSDGHPISGLLEFSVGDGPAVDPASASAAGDTTGSGWPAAPIAVGAAAAAAMIGTALVWIRRRRRTAPVQTAD